jgi:hypothetical protein
MIKNYNQTIDLIRRYRSITLEQIRMEWGKHYCSHDVAKALTGYGTTGTCLLCKPIRTNHSCTGCIHMTGNKMGSSYDIHCLHGHSHNTYYQIGIADSPEELLSTFKNRADYLERLYWKAKKRKFQKIV